jgi:hypothetical protein
MSATSFSASGATPQTRYAAAACIARVQLDARGLSYGGGSPLQTVKRIADRLEKDVGPTNIAWVIRASASAGQGESTTRASAWPVWFQAGHNGYERPLLYLLRSSTLPELQALTVEARGRGILCNDAETQPSGWPKGAQPAVPLWLASDPLCIPYDPASGEEARAIVLSALQTLYLDGAPGFYYLAAHDDAGIDPEPLSERCAADAVKGMYLHQPVPADHAKAEVRLLGAGKALRAVIGASRLLREEWGIASKIWSCPSYTRLAREGHAIDRWNMLHPQAPRRTCHLQQCLGPGPEPTIAATGYSQHIADQIGAFVPGSFIGMGANVARSRSATGSVVPAALDERWITTVALKALADDQRISPRVVGQAVRKYGLT